MALEALENCRIEYDYHGNPIDEENANLLKSIDTLRTALAAPEPESKTPAWWMDGLTATLMREGVNKHRAREIAQGYWEAYCQIPGTEEDIDAAMQEDKT
jgi:hypothetical protein